MHISGKVSVHVHVISQPYVHTFPLLFLQAEKFKFATRIKTKLASLSSEFSKSEFAAHYELLEKLLFIGKLEKASLVVQFLVHTELHAFVK